MCSGYLRNTVGGRALSSSGLCRLRNRGEPFLRVGWLLALLLVGNTTPAAEPNTEKIECRGVVVDEKDQPLAGAEVRAYSDEKSDPVTTAADGTFALRLPPKTIRWQIIARQAATSRMGAWASYPASKTDTLKRDLASLRIVIEPARDLLVNVVDKNNTPVPSAKVGAIVGFENIATAQTGADGNATLKVPRTAQLNSVFGYSPGSGLDYVCFRHQGDTTDANALPLDHAGPITLVMAGVKPLSLKVTHRDGSAAAGAVFFPREIWLPKKGGFLFAMGYRDLGVLADETGTVHFDFLPINMTSRLSFGYHTPGYVATKLPEFSPQDGVDEIEVMLDRLVPFRGLVTDSQGRPVADAVVKFGSMGLGPISTARDYVTTATDGVFEALVPPNQYYAFRASKGNAFSSCECCVVLHDADPPFFTLKLEPGARIVGKVTQGEESKPLPRAHVTLRDYPELPTEELPPDIHARIFRGRRHIRELCILESFDADENGDFVIPVGAGQHELAVFQLNPRLTSSRERIMVAEPKEYRKNLHAVPQPR